MSKKTILSILLLLSIFSGSVVRADAVVHILKRGETLYSVSRQYNISADELIRFNNITNPDRLREGQEIRIPDFYVVVRGDTLFGVARSHGITIDELTSANNLTRDSGIRIGQKLLIPRQGSTVVSAPKTLPGGTAAPPVANFTDPRNYETRTVDAAIIWPVKVLSISYLTGKVFGVSITSEAGERVKTIASGTVISAGPYRGFGQVVFVQSKNGHIYVYGGLESIIPRIGESLSFGENLGTLRPDALSGKPQLYFMVYNRDVPIDPAKAPRGF